MSNRGYSPDYHVDLNAVFYLMSQKQKQNNYPYALVITFFPKMLQVKHVERVYIGPFVLYDSEWSFCSHGNVIMKSE